MFEVDSPPDQTHHCGWTTDCRFAARRTTASARRATGLAQPSLAARRATALDDGRTCPTGRPRQPQRTLAHCVPAVSPHWHRTGQKANRSRAVSISQPEGQGTRLRGLPRSGKALMILLIAKSSSTWSRAQRKSHWTESSGNDHPDGVAAQPVFSEGEILVRSRLACVFLRF